MIPFFNSETPGRYERKFVIPNSSLKEVEAQVLLHPALFRRIHHPRMVNNIYLDSPEFNHYLDNVEGNARRRKLRVRWYGELTGEIKSPILEIKEKSGHIGWKSSFPLQPCLFPEQIKLRKLQDVMECSSLPPALLQDIRTLQPSLVNRYHRKYYLSLDGRFRITLDDRLAYYRVNYLETGFSSPHREDSEVIMELKYSQENDFEAEYITNNFPWRLGKNSKYVSGVSAIQSI
jgi:SPX domain protein involved in polyphosphate accumulation